MFIAILGCDGSGKSAVINQVVESLKKQGVTTTHGHWRPVAFSSGLMKGVKTNSDDPHGQVLRGPSSSILKLGWLWWNWWLGWFSFLRKESAAGVVLFDRYHADILVDPLRYRYGGPMWLARLASQWMPQPDLVMFLDAEPDVLLSRKQEVSREALERARALYLALCETNNRYHVIDAGQPLEDVVESVLVQMRNLH